MTHVTFNIFISILLRTKQPHTDLKTGRIVPLHSCFEFGQLPLEKAALWTVNIVPSMRVLNLFVRNTDSLA